MKHYALEIYTAVAMFLIVLVALFMPELSIIQKFVVFMSFVFILHEWEEGRYPGGFLDLIMQLLQRKVDDETVRASRLVTAVLIYALTLLPFFFGDAYPMFAVAVATFCIFEGFIHIFGIRIFRLPKFYTPGMVTAEVEAVTGIALIVYLAVNHLGAWYDYVCGPFIFLACFACMQRTLMSMVGGLHYSDMPKLIKAQLSKR
ncbi:MAG: HXXEE domain-containing protein [Bacteroidales bacterium]|nr:HXXEE domain-containing protein [Bacteroidales bacterium]